MRRRRLVAAFAGAALLVLVPVAAQGANGHANYRAVCPAPPSGSAHCHALVVTDAHGNPAVSTSPTGLSPATIKSVYGFSTSSTAGAGETIAIVDAYDDPNAESDLGVFSSQYGLPACTTANGCFKKVDQTGGTNYPRANSGWALEISLDVQWAHAIAPGAKILLVEASSNSFSNLLAAEDYAKAHAQYVSNSWGASEFSGESGYDSHFSQSGVSFFVSAGDAGLPAEYPSASPNVISVGGTTLHFSGSTFTGETGWSSGGGGCSSYETATAAQFGFSGYGQVNCGGKRATPDVSLDADPNSGVSVYDSTPYYGQSGWWTVGGTSASSPMWAARSADAGAVVNSAYVYGSSITYRDITSGNNGAPCLVGFDLCTGRGSWTGSTPSGGGGGGSTSPDFSISATPPSGTVTQGGSTTYTVATTAINGDSSSVDLSVTGLPSGAAGSFNPSNPTAGNSSTLTVTTSSNTPTSSYTLTIWGNDGTNMHSTTVTLVVQPPQTAGFTLSVSPGNRTVKAGSSASYTVSVTPSGGYAGTVDLSFTSSPIGVSGGFSATSIDTSASLSSTLTVQAGAKGTYTLTIVGTDSSNSSLTASATVTLKVR